MHTISIIHSKTLLVTILFSSNLPSHLSGAPPAREPNQGQGSDSPLRPGCLCSTSRLTHYKAHATRVTADKDRALPHIGRGRVKQSVPVSETASPPPPRSVSVPPNLTSFVVTGRVTETCRTVPSQLGYRNVPKRAEPGILPIHFGHTSGTFRSSSRLAALNP